MIFNRDPAPHLPRLVLAILAIAIVRHLIEFALRLGEPTHIPAYHWAILAASEMAMAAVAAHRPHAFLVRRFRLPGMAVSALTGMLLIPLPPIAGAYGDLVDEQMILAIASGVATMAFIFWFAAVSPPTPSRVPARRASRATAWSIVGFAALLLPIWIATIGSLPIVQLLTGSATGVEIAGARSQALKEIGSVPLRLAIGAMRNLYLFLGAGWLVADWKLSEQGSRLRFIRGVAAVGACGLAAFYALVTTERALLGHLVVIMTVVVLTTARRELGGRNFGVAVAGALSFPFLFGLLNLGSDVLGAFNSITRRIFFVPTDVMTLHFVAFPVREDFLYGSSIPKISRLWGAETFDLSGFIFDSFFGRSAAFQGNANASFFAVGWANAGLIGVVIWSAMTAAALLWFDRLIDRLPIRWSAPIRGLAVVQALLLTSSDIFRSLLGFGPGFLDLVLITVIVLYFHERSTVIIDVGRERRPSLFHRNRLVPEPERLR